MLKNLICGRSVAVLHSQLMLIIFLRHPFRLTGNSRTRLANNSFLKVMCYWRENDCRKIFHHLVPLRRRFTLLYDIRVLVSHLWHISACENMISWCLFPFFQMLLFLHAFTHVLSPADSSDNLPLKWSQFAPPSEIDKFIDQFLSRCQPHIQELVNSVDDIPSFLPSWKPDHLRMKLSSAIYLSFAYPRLARIDPV